MQWGGTTKPWGSADVIGTIVGFFAILGAFGVNEYYHGDRALFVPRILKNKTLLIMCVYVCFIAGAFFTWLYYLPLYFQSVKGVSPSESGIRNLPLIMGTAIFSIVCGGTISATGHYVPIMVIGSLFTVVGSGMLYTFDINTSSSHWIGYQIICGIGIGLAFQIPIIVSQSTSAPGDLSSVTAIVLFFQTVTGSIFVSIAQALFTNKLLSAAVSYAPDVSPEFVLATGASNLRTAFTPEQLPGVVLAYMDGLRDSFTLAIPLSGIAVLVAVFALAFDYRILNQAPAAADEEKQNKSVDEEKA